MATCTLESDSPEREPAADSRGVILVFAGWLWRLLRFLAQLGGIAGYLLAAALLFPVLASLVNWTVEREQYGHFPLLAAAAAVFAAFRVYCDRPPFFGGLSFRVLAWTAIAFGLIAVVYLLPSRWLAGIAAWSLIAAVTAFLGGGRLSAKMAGPMLLLAAAIPLPVNLDSWLIVEMQHLATRLASLWLDLAGVLHFTSGVAIQTPGRDFFVEDACSGIHSLFAAIAVGVGYGVLREYRLLRVMALVLQMIFWVVTANSLRVFWTVYSETSDSHAFLAPLASLDHESLGVVTFAGGILLALCGDGFVRYLFPIGGDPLGEGADGWDLEDEDRWWDLPLPAWCFWGPGVGAVAAAAVLQVSPPAPATAMLENVWNRFAVPRPEAGWGTLENAAQHCVGHWASHWDGGARSAPLPPSREMQEGGQLGALSEEGGETLVAGRRLPKTFMDLGAVDADFLPLELQGWQRVDFRVQRRSPDDPFGGLISHIWRYSKGGRTASISLDGPYSGWHNLAICYQGLGWVIADTDDVGFVGESEEGIARKLQLTRSPLDHAHVLFACFDPDGRCVPPPPHMGGLWSMFAGRIEAVFSENSDGENAVVQVQVLEETVGEREAGADEETEELFEAVVGQVAGSW